VLEAVLVGGDRVWCYGCDGCCPPEGRLRDPDSPAAVAIAAAHALLGERVLASRAEVVRSVQPIGGIAALSVRQAIVRVLGRLTGEEEARAAVVEDARACFADLTVRFWSPPATVEHDEAALVGVGLVDVRFRDEVLCGLVDEPAAALPLLLALARLVPPAFDAPICTVLGCAAYLAGDGVLATTAFERALSSDRDYSLARLTMRLLAAGVPPDELAAEWRAAAPEVARLAARVRRAPGRTPP
jgi:hypothetical protein